MILPSSYRISAICLHFFGRYIRHCCALPRILLVSLLLSLLLACSSAPSIPKPLPLNDIFNPSIKITSQWHQQIGVGQNGNYRAQPLRTVLNENLICTAAMGGQVSCVDASTGAIQWQVDLQSTVISGLGKTETSLLVVTADGVLHLLSTQDGSTLWRRRLASESLSVAQANQQAVFVQTIDGRLSAYNIEQGDLIWSYSSDVPNLTVRGTSSPAVDEVAVYVGFANGKLTALDSKKGDVLWQQRVGIPSGRSEVQRLVDIDAPLLLANKTLYVNSYQGNTAALDAVFGQLLWQTKASSLIQPSVSADAVYIVTDKSSVIALRRDNGNELWRNDEYLHRGLSQVLVLEQGLLVTDAQGFVHVLDDDTGATLGRAKGQHLGAATSVLFFDDHIYVTGQNARLSSFSIQSLQ